MSFLSHVAYTPKEKHNKENEVGMVLYSIFPGSFITRSSGYYSLRVFFHCSTMYKNTRDVFTKQFLDVCCCCISVIYATQIGMEIEDSIFQKSFPNLADIKDN